MAIGRTGRGSAYAKAGTAANKGRSQGSAYAKSSRTVPSGTRSVSRTAAKTAVKPRKMSVGPRKVSTFRSTGSKIRGRG